ncbi:hypothetical protein VTL71DRAFT_2264 [Oculimacula yallundae]|uniref:BAG domain-containing protein n=1 Tax=Oculimacula yallundae TaxID=86028 RepID=A0ABR4C8E2_9HELO
MAEPSSIASCGSACSALFPLLIGSLIKEPNLQEQLSPDAVKDESKRFELWARNIAALQDAHLPSSLEHRLRDDASARGIVRKALLYLEESLQMALSIASGERENEVWDSPSPSEETTNPSELLESASSELIELGLAIQEGITNLFQLSMIIRKKPERDEYLKASLTYTIDPIADIIHVGDKYPIAKRGEKWLMERLGIAITRRRQYLLYRKEHQEKMEQVHMLKVGVDGKTVWSGEKASTYHPNEILEDSRPVDLGTGDFKGTARTEYADSSKGKDGASNFLRTPLLPKDSMGIRADYNQHFECPYCRRPQKVQDKNEWKKHVFSDLRPYVCTFESCGLNMFESQNQWFEHEMRFHRKQWACQHCKEATVQTRPDLEKHMSLIHADKLHERPLEGLLDACQISRVNATECPLCIEYGEKFQKINRSTKCDVSLKQFQEHLGRHMEQLALSALPQEEVDGDEGLASDDAESSSTRSYEGIPYEDDALALAGQLEGLDGSDKASDKTNQEDDDGSKEMRKKMQAEGKTAGESDKSDYAYAPDQMGMQMGGVPFYHNQGQTLPHPQHQYPNVTSDPSGQMHSDNDLAPIRPPSKTPVNAPAVVDTPQMDQDTEKKLILLDHLLKQQEEGRTNSDGQGQEGPHKEGQSKEAQKDPLVGLDLEAKLALLNKMMKLQYLKRQSLRDFGEERSNVEQRSEQEQEADITETETLENTLEAATSSTYTCCNCDAVVHQEIHSTTCPLCGHHKCHDCGTAEYPIVPKRSDTRTDRPKSMMEPPDTNSEDDSLLLICGIGDTIYRLYFPANTIDSGKLQVRDINQRAIQCVHPGKNEILKLFYADQYLKDQMAPARDYGLKNGSKIFAAVGTAESDDILEGGEFEEHRKSEHGDAKAPDTPAEEPNLITRKDFETYAADFDRQARSVNPSTTKTMTFDNNPVDWSSNTFCLACDRQTDGQTFCSDACRLAAYQNASHAGSPTRNLNYSPIRLPVRGNAGSFSEVLSDPEEISTKFTPEEWAASFEPTTFMPEVNSRPHPTSQPRGGSHIKVDSVDATQFGQTRVESEIPVKSPGSTEFSAKSESRRAAIQQLDALSKYFHGTLIPLCEKFLFPGSADVPEAENIHRQLSQRILSEVLLKLDAVETEGDPEARAVRKGLVSEAQASLKTLDQDLALFLKHESRKRNEKEIREKGEKRKKGEGTEKERPMDGRDDTK